MTAKLVTVPEFRAWAGTAYQTVPDGLVQQCLDTAESAMVARVRCGTVDAIIVNLDANAVAVTEVCLRAANLLAKRNSPEGVAGIGEIGVINIPASPAGSAENIMAIKTHLGIPLVVVA